MALLLQHMAAVQRTRRRDLAGFSKEEILIVPTRRRVRQLLRERLLAGGRAVIAVPPFQTLETFAEALYRNLRIARPRVSLSLRTFLFSRAVRDARKELRFFAPRAREPHIFPGTFDRIAATVTALRDAGFFAGDLEKELSGTGDDDRLMLHDLALIARRYEQNLEERGLQDEAGLLYHLNEEITVGELDALLEEAFPGCGRLTLDSFDQFSSPEYRLLERLAQVPGLSITVRLDYHATNPELFSHLDPLIHRLEETGFVRVEELPGPVSRPADQLAPFLFRTSGAPSRVDFTGTLALVRAQDRVREVEEICRIIKHAVVSGEVRDPGRVCVAMRHLDKYAEIMRETFPQYGIPLNMTNGFLLSRSPLAIDVLGLLRMVAFGYQREDLLQVAASPYFRFSRDQTIDAANLAGVAYRLRVSGGVEAWRDAFRRREARLPLLASRSDDPEQFLKGEGASLRKASADFTLIVETTALLAEPMTPEGFRDRFVNRLERLGLPGIIDGIDGTSDQLQEREARAFQVLVTLTDSLSRFMRRGKAFRPLSVYLEQLRLAVGRERYNVRERPGWGVLVTALEEIRGLEFDLLIVPGMVDGEFPISLEPDLFLDAGRRQERERRHLARERYQLYQALASWRGRLVFTSPEREGDVELVESPFVQAIRDVAAVRKGSPVPAEAVYTASELLARLPDDVPVSLPVPDSLRPVAAEVRRVRLVEESRRSTHTLGAYEGILTHGLSGRGRARLSHLKDEVFSVSQLEEYGECPFRFLLTRLLRLRRADLVVEELTGLERGAVIHEVLFSFFLDRRARRLPPLREASEKEFEQAVRDMHAIARRILERLDIPDLFWEYEKERIVGVPGRRKGLLQAFVEEERKRADAVHPLHFEAAFGRGGRNDPTDPQLTVPQPVAAGRVALKGKIDRIDGNDSCYVIVDYKTGAGIPSMEEIRSGVSLQLPLYLHVVDQLLHATGRQLRPAGGLYYHVRDPVRLRLGLGVAEWSGEAFPAPAGRRRLVRSEAELRDVVQHAIRTAERHVDAMTRGDFPLVPPDRAQRPCASCDFAAVCRLRTITRGSSSSMEES